jgi:hypothetical protein
VALLAEISDSSLRFDLTDKAPVYAAAGVAEFWVVDVDAGIIHQMWSPLGESYAQRKEVRFGERIEAATVEGLAVETLFRVDFLHFVETEEIQDRLAEFVVLDEAECLGTSAGYLVSFR